MKSTIGFIGLGEMGRHMASNLIKNKRNVVLFDKDTSKLADFTKSAEIVNEIGKINSETVITMLPNDAIVLQVYKELSKIKETKLFIDSSTISPKAAKQVSELCDGRMIDAPVSGGVNGAKNGTLTFMVGGSLENYNLSKEVLKLMGKNIFHCGGAGTGQIAKICNNMLLAIRKLN